MKSNWKETAQVKDAELSTYEAQSISYTQRLKTLWQDGGYDAPESSLNLPFDGALLKRVEEAAQRLRTPELHNVVVIGIGGSSLGAKAIYDALFGFLDVLDFARTPRAIFLETLDSSFLEALITKLSGVSSSREFAVVVVSKSGTTTETLANAAALFQKLVITFPDIFSRTAIISNEGSPLAQLGATQGALVLTLPQAVGGRYSIFSAAGLLPLALLGVDVASLSRGAGEVVSALLEDTDRAAIESAMVLAYHHDSGRRIHDLFMFSPRLESLGKWYRQLLAESIGKERQVVGGTAHIGFTPTVSIGTTDFHSTLQLYLAGPRDKVTTFVHVPASIDVDQTEQLHAGVPFLSILPQIAERSLSEVTWAAIVDVKQAYLSSELPYMSLELSEISAHELGAFMQYSMLQTMYLGNLLSVNAFDQPAVEAYKEKALGLLRS